jgi:SAM-dependent MidA family methyltransferase
MATPGTETAPEGALARALAAAIRRDGPMTFGTFMSRCLYDAEYGYYAVPERPVGRGGDFHTSVSVGPVFGELIAEWVARSWEQLGRPTPVRLGEQGAHDGCLMADVVGALARRHPLLHAAVRPLVVEPLPARRAGQQRRLAEAGVSAEWVETWDALAGQPPVPMIFFANELLDAFPVDRWHFDGSGWQQLLVGLDTAGRFRWQSRAVTGCPLPGVAGADAGPWPAGYETETCPGLGEWVRELGRAMPVGRALVIDYGREASDYYAPHRTTGTLRGYRGHRRCDDPLAAPGQTDLTADVNFSALAEAAGRAGFRVHGPERQGVFLTRLAAARLLEPPLPEAAWRRQFQTLTHPNHLGHLFHAVVLEKPGPA